MYTTACDCTTAEYWPVKDPRCAPAQMSYTEKDIDAGTSSMLAVTVIVSADGDRLNSDTA